MTELDLLDLLDDVAVARPVDPQVMPGVDPVLPADAAHAVEVPVAHRRRLRLGARLDVDRHGFAWGPAPIAEANDLLAREHYLGPIRSGRLVFGGWTPDGELAAVQVWRHPTSRRLPTDGTWLELSRWCLTPAAGDYAGSRQHRAAVRYLRRHDRAVTTFASYSDPSVGHTGALYRSCNWRWSPTWHRLRTPPTGNGRWTAGGKVEAVKDRWIFPVQRDPRRDAVLRVDDPAAIRAWLAGSPPLAHLRWAREGLATDLREATR